MSNFTNITKEYIYSKINISSIVNSELENILFTKGHNYSLANMIEYLENISDYDLLSRFNEQNRTVLKEIISAKQTFLYQRDAIIQEVIQNNTNTILQDNAIDERSNIANSSSRVLFKGASVDNEVIFQPINNWSLQSNTDGSFTIDMGSTAWCPYTDYQIRAVKLASNFSDSLICVKYPSDMSTKDIINFRYALPSSLQAALDSYIYRNYNMFIKSTDISKINYLSKNAMASYITSLFPSSLKSDPLLNQGDTTFDFADVNGDGFLDLMLLYKIYPAQGSSVNPFLPQGLSVSLEFYIFNNATRTYASGSILSNLYPDYNTYTNSGWCFSNILNIKIGDFNGDGLSDLLCPSPFSVLYNCGIIEQVVTFRSRSGSGDGLIGFFQNWGDPKNIYVGDFDGDNYSDVVSVVKSGVNKGIYMLFGSKTNLFISRSSNEKGLLVDFNPTCVLLENSYLVIGDYDGDGRDDIMCHTSSKNYMFFSKTLPLNHDTISDVTAKIVVQDIKLSNLFLDSTDVQTSFFKYVCNNQARPNNLLSCEFSTSSSTSSTTSGNSFATWLNHGTGVETIVSFEQPIAVLNISTNKSVAYNFSSTEKNSFSASAKISVGSYDCNNLNLITKSLSNVPTTYTAIATFSAISNLNQMLHGSELLELAKKVIENPLSISLSDPSNVAFTISGDMMVNVMLESYAEINPC